MPKHQPSRSADVTCAGHLAAVTLCVVTFGCDEGKPAAASGIEGGRPPVSSPPPDAGVPVEADAGAPPGDDAGSPLLHDSGTTRGNDAGRVDAGSTITCPTVASSVDQGTMDAGPMVDPLSCDLLGSGGASPEALATAIVSDYLTVLETACASRGVVPEDPLEFIEWSNQLHAFVRDLFGCPEDRETPTTGYPPVGPAPEQSPLLASDLALASESLAASIVRLADLDAAEAASLCALLQARASAVPTCEDCSSRWNVCEP